MSEVRSYRDLLVWQQAVDLAVAVYELTRAWPRDELYGLTSQARRAAVSVCANIAEGYGRDTRAAYVQFLPLSFLRIQRIAQPVAQEVEREQRDQHRGGR